VAIGQASHAWLSGQLARGWGSGRFDAPEPWEEVCSAAEEHGMAGWGTSRRSFIRPQSFMEMSLNDHLRLRSAAPAKLLTQSRYAALFVSLHGTALYERRDLARMPPADAGVVRAYLARERALQERLITPEQEHSQRQRPRPQSSIPLVCAAPICALALLSRTSSGRAHPLEVGGAAPVRPLVQCAP
jgi:hypothetical protein